jgi:hypothetical protein
LAEVLLHVPTWKAWGDFSRLMKMTIYRQCSRSTRQQLPYDIQIEPSQAYIIYISFPILEIYAFSRWYIRPFPQTRLIATVAVRRGSCKDSGKSSAVLSQGFPSASASNKFPIRNPPYLLPHNLDHRSAGITHPDCSTSHI